MGLTKKRTLQFSLYCSVVPRESNLRSENVWESFVVNSVNPTPSCMDGQFARIFVQLPVNIPDEMGFWEKEASAGIPAAKKGDMATIMGFPCLASLQACWLLGYNHGNVGIIESEMPHI